MTSAVRVSEVNNYLRTAHNRHRQLTFFYWNWRQLTPTVCKHRSNTPAQYRQYAQSLKGTGFTGSTKCVVTKLGTHLQKYCYRQTDTSRFLMGSIMLSTYRNVLAEIVCNLEMSLTLKCPWHGIYWPLMPFNTIHNAMIMFYVPQLGMKHLSHLHIVSVY